MFRRTGAVSRVLVAVLSRAPLLALAGMAALGASASTVSVIGKDYALCFGDESGDQGPGTGLIDKKGANAGKASADQRIAACTVIAEDDAETLRLRTKAYFYRGAARDDKQDWNGAIADYGEVIALDPKQTSAYFNRGTDWSNKGDDDRAVADFNIVISLEPSASDAHSSRGSAFLRKGKIAAAMLDFQQAIEADPQNGNAHTGLGTAWSKAGERDKAIAEHDKAIRIDPTDFTALVNRGIAYAAKDEFDRAIADYDAALAVDPRSADAYANRSAAWLGKNDWARAIADANRAIELDAGIVDGYYARAVAWANKDNNDRALADFDKVIALDATDARAWLGRSLMRSRKGDSAGAAADCRKAIALDPKNTGGCDAGPADAEMPAAETVSKPDLSSLAKQLEATGRQIRSKEAAAQIRDALKQQVSGDVSGAIASFGYAISLDPDNAEAYYDRAVAAASQGDNALAASDCRRAVELDPQHTSACAALTAGQQTVQVAETQAAARILVDRAGVRLAKYGVDRALLDFDKAISLDPKSADAYLGRSRARTLKGDKAGAAQDCRRAVDLDPARSGSCNEQLAGDNGKIAPAQDLGKPKPAVAAAKAQAVRPNLTATQDTLAAKSLEAKDPRALQAVLGGDAWVDMGKYDKAIGAYGQAIALDPDYRFGYFGRGRASAAKGDYGQAIADFDRVIQLAPNFAAAYFRRGLAKVTSGDADGALADCERAAKLDSKARDAHYCKGMAWHAKGDAGRAIAAYSVAIGIDAKDDASYYARGMARADRKDYAGAIADFDQAFKLDPDNRDYAIAGKAAVAAGAESATAPSAGIAGPSDVADVIGNGDRLTKEGEYDRALAEYSRAIKLDPDNAIAHYRRGVALARKGDYDGAIAEHTQALALNPQYRDVYFSRGWAWSRKNEPDRAISDYSKGLQFDPTNAAGFSSRATMWMAKGDYDRAIADLDVAIAIDPVLPDAHFARGLAWGHKGDFDKALADYDRALKLNPNDPALLAVRTSVLPLAHKRPEAAATAKRQSGGIDDTSNPEAVLTLLERGDAFYKKRKYARAIAEYSRAVTLAPTEPTAYSARALARLQSGQYDGAVADYSQALELDPDYAEAYSGRAFALVKKREPEKAIADLDRAIAIKPDHAPYYFGRGSAWYYIGDFDRAVADLDRAIELDPKFDIARQSRKMAMAAKEKSSRSADRKKARSLKSN